jgi:hypothetical protein
MSALLVGHSCSSPISFNKLIEEDIMKLKLLSEGHWVKADPTKRMSFLLHPSDREKFIRWGKKKPKRK